MINLLRKIYFFNQYERDLWVRKKAAIIPDGARVLDIGAGTCPYRSFFTNCEYKTQDFTKLEVDQLRDQKGYGTIDYISDIMAIPVQENSFDLILCTEVLEHLPYPFRAIQEFARILRPGGKLLVTAPLGSGLHQEPYHFYGGFTPHWYRKVLGECGFVNIIIEPNGGFLKHYAQESFRFTILFAPWKGIKELLLVPIWVISLPWTIVLLPFLGYLFDSVFQERSFTVGYHVTAELRS